MLPSARGGRPRRPRLLPGRARADRAVGPLGWTERGAPTAPAALHLRPGRGPNRRCEGTTRPPLIERRTSRPAVSVADRATRVRRRAPSGVKLLQPVEAGAPGSHALDRPRGRIVACMPFARSGGPRSDRLTVLRPLSVGGARERFNGTRARARRTADRDPGCGGSGARRLARGRRYPSPSGQRLGLGLYYREAIRARRRACARLRGHRGRGGGS
jgi:hypothetical protein